VSHDHRADTIRIRGSAGIGSHNDMGGLKMMQFEQSPDVEEWKCATQSKACKGQDPCFFNDERKRCPMGFRIKVKKVGL
jgi:hypothetical protein